MADSGKIKVLMLGWEYPPFINGGLGVACEGLGKALAHYVDLGLLVPMAPPGASAGDLKVTGLNETDLSTLSQGSHPLLDRYKKIVVPLQLAPYADATTVLVHQAEPAPVPSAQEDEQEETLEKQEPPASLAQTEPRAFVLTEPYGPDLHEKVLQFGHLVTGLAETQEFDLIHAHDWMTFLPGMELKQATGKPLVLHVHSLSYDRAGQEGIQGWVFDLEKEAMEMADLVVPVSLYTAEVIEQYYGIPRSKLRPLHNGIEPVQAYRLEKPFPEKLVVFLGRLTAQKGPDHFLDMAFRVLEGQKDVRFVLAGHGPLDSALMLRVAERRLGDRIHFAGFLGRREVHDLLAMADVFVMPSQSDPFGLAALEAAQFGVPCVLSRQCGVQEVLPEAPSVEHWDADKMATVVRWLLDSPEEARALGGKLQARAARLNWHDTAQALTRLYQSLL